MTTRCLICQNVALRRYIDAGLNDGLSNAGIAAGLTAAGGKIDPDVIGRHKANHWFPPVDPAAAKPTKRDLAIMLRDKVADAIAPMSGEALLAFGVELAPMVGQGLKAEAIIDKREATAKKLGLAAGALGFQMYLAGLGRREGDPTPELEDPTVIPGEFTEVDDEAD